MTRTPTLGRSPLVLAVLPLLFASAAAADPATPPPTCEGHTITAYVVALDRVIRLNRFGSQMPGGMIYALARDVFPKPTTEDPAPGYYSEQNSCRFAQPIDPKGQTICAPGSVRLRPDKRPRPLVLRAHEGDCLEIHFTNLLSPQPAQGSLPQPSTRDAGIHVQGLNWVCGSQDDGSNVGKNASSLVQSAAAPTAGTVAAGTAAAPTAGSAAAPATCTAATAAAGTAVYTLYAEHEGSYLLYNTADGWTSLATNGTGDGGTLAEGLFGAVNVQPSGRHFQPDWDSEFYRSQVTEQDLCLASVDKVTPGDPLHCARRHPHLLPVLNYQALYPPGHPRANLPILNMVCTNRLTPDAIGNVCEDGELVHSDLTAMITGPSAQDSRRWPPPPPQPRAFPHNQPADDLPPSLRPIYAYPDRFQPFREFTVIYHESFQVTQAFPDEISTKLPSLAAAADNFGINYGMAGLSNEVLANRLGAGPLKQCVDCKYEEFFLSSWAMGDPAMIVDPPANACLSEKKAPTGCDQPRARYPDDPSNVYHAYMSDHVRFRVLHAGPDLHHLHHQHAQQWLGTPNSPDGDYLDSQLIGPGSAFTMEMVYNGSGNVNKTVGDSIFHCHFYPHFASGMWSLWRVHDVFEGGTILDDQGYPANRKREGVVEYTRALPDGEIQQGAPTVALVPLPTLPMAPMPAAVQLQGVCSKQPAKNCGGGVPGAEATCTKAEGTCIEMGSRYCVVQPLAGKCISEFQSTDKSWDQVEKTAYPGYPFFIPGIGGSRPPHPPLDFAYACAKSGRICDPTILKDAKKNQNPKVEGLQAAATRAAQRHLISEAPRPEYAAPIFADQICGQDEGDCEPMDGGLPRAVTAQGPKDGPSSGWRTPQPAQNLDFSKEIEKAQAIELPETGTEIEKVAMKMHAQRFHYDTQLPDGRRFGTCSDNRAPCTRADLAQCGNPDKAICEQKKKINFVLNGLPPQPGAPYADPCIRFDRNGGQPHNMPTRSYLAADLQLDAIFNREGWHFPQQRMLSLWGDVKDFLDRKKPPEPLFMRVNSYDCMTYVLANLVPNVYEQDEFQVRTPTDVIGQHIHLVKFDVTSSDGAENGWNYEDGTYGPNEVTERIRAINKVGGIYQAPVENEPGAPRPSGSSGQRCLKAKYIKFFGPGPGAKAKPDSGSETTGTLLGSQAAGACPTDADTTGAWVGSQATVQRWYDDPLYNNTGRCSTDLNRPCTLGQEQAGIPPCPNQGFCATDAGFCLDAYGESQNCTQSLRDLCCTQLDRKLCKVHPLTGYYDPAYFSNCEPSHDRTIRTVFTHDHFGPSTHQQAGLYAGVVAEPKGSVWRNNETGEIMGGYDAATNQNYALRCATGNGVSVKDGGPTSWQAVIETPQVGDSFREFLLEVQDSTLLYAPFQVGANPMALLRPEPCRSSSEPCGFCSLTGWCSSLPKTQCQIPSLGGTAPTVQGCGTCLFGLNPADANNPYLAACTPTNLKGCYYNQNSTLANVTPESCNFIPGIPSQAWTPLLQTTTPATATTPATTQTTTQATTLSGPIDPNFPSTPHLVTVEAITLRGSTNSFSFNYRDEPLYPRIDSPPSSATSSPAPKAGSRGDLAFVYSSLQFCQKDARKVCSRDSDCGSGDQCVNRPNPRGFRCSLNLNQICQANNDCSSGMGDCEEVGFCSDNYALCTDDNRTLCGATAATCLAKRISTPYPPLTAGVEATDPFTPLLRGYAGDDVQLRVLIGAHINPHNFTLHGLNWLNQPSYVDSGWRNSQAMGISEHYNLLVKLDPLFTPPAGEAPLKQPWMDYLYQPGAAAIEQAAGNWGLIRAYHERHADLWPLPQNDYRPGTDFKPVPLCPEGQPPRTYEVVALTAAQALGGPLVYNTAQGISDAGALLFFDLHNPYLTKTSTVMPTPDLTQNPKCAPPDWTNCCAPPDWSNCHYHGKPEPLVLRAAAGDCIQVTLYNGLPYGYCNTAPLTSCTPDNMNTVCPLPACTNNACNNSTTTSCTTVNDCPQLACGPPTGISSLQLQASLTTSTATTTLPAYTSNLSLHVGLRPQLVTADPRFSDGTNAGFNPRQTAPPGGSKKYIWYAGHIDVDNDGNAIPIPIEFGASNLLPPDPINQAQHGLFGGLIIEPKGAWWHPPKVDPPKPGTSLPAGVDAVVHYGDPYNGEHTFHEFVIFTSDDVNLSKLTSVNNPGKQAFDLLNYSTELLNTNNAPPRFCNSSTCSTSTSADVSCVLSTKPGLYGQGLSSQGTCTVPTTPSNPCLSCTFTPETPTFCAHVRDKVRFRLLHPGGTNTNEVFELAGHTYLQTPYETPLEACEAPTTHTNLFASQRMGEQNLCGSAEFLPEEYLPQMKEKTYRTKGRWSASLSEWKASRPMHGPGNHFDVLIHEAGGPYHQCGDYLYRSYPADHFGLGIWGIFHVWGCPEMPEPPECK